MFSPIEDLVLEIASGNMVILTDDASRENEGDLVFAAQFVMPEKINFMSKYGRGLICVPLEEKRLEHLGLRNMVEQSHDDMRTAFTLSVDAAHGITTGISAFDRARTVEVLVDDKYDRHDIVSPGHVFPLRAKKGGVLRRAGHTEAAVDLARLAGLKPAGVICEIMNEDGTMARTPDLIKFAEQHGLKMGTIQDLIEFRRRSEKLIEHVASCDFQNDVGRWRLHLYRSLVDQKEHVALVMGQVDERPSLVRVHSECFTGDVLVSLRCDCREQLRTAMALIAREGRGVLVYMRQEGRGIGLSNKIRAYALQDEGLDTIEANERLGFKPDLREYGIGAQILKDIGLAQIRLITNNPRKIVGLDGYGLHVVERVHLQIPAHSGNERYIRTKQDKLGHFTAP